MLHQQPKHDDQYTGAYPTYYGESHFIFNEASGLYEPKSYVAEKRRQCRQRGTSSHHPLIVRSLTDWAVFTVSVVTLLLLGGTVYFANQQWGQMVIAANGSLRSARASWANAEIANNALEDSRRSSEFTQRQMEAQSWSQWQSAQAAVRASVAAAKQVSAMQDLADQAARSATTAESAFKSQVRPWVGIVGGITIHPVVETPQTFRIGGVNGHNETIMRKSIQVDLGMKNYGSLPALHVNFLAVAVPQTGNQDKDIIRLNEVYDRICPEAKSNTVQLGEIGSYPAGPEGRERVPMMVAAIGTSIFPTDTAGEDITMTNIHDSLDRPFYMAGCVGYTDKNPTSVGDAAAAYTPGIVPPYSTRFCFVSNAGLDSISQPTQLTGQCLYNQAAD